MIFLCLEIIKYRSQNQDFCRMVDLNIGVRPLSRQGSDHGSGLDPERFPLNPEDFQARPGSYSWFAHSFPLEILVETGVVGFVLFVTVGWMIIKNMRGEKENKGVLWAIGLTLLYSLLSLI